MPRIAWRGSISVTVIAVLLGVSSVVMASTCALTRWALHTTCRCNAEEGRCTERAMDVHFTNLLIVVAAAFAAPLALGLVPALKLPSVVLEIVAGIVLGPSVLGWVEVDQAVEVLATIGLAFLLFLAGLEIEFHKLRGRPLVLASLGYGLSFALALVGSLLLDAAGLAQSPLLVAIILTATSLGIVVPVLKDAGEIETGFGQLVVAAASIADFGAIVLLSLFFSREATGTGTKASSPRRPSRCSRSRSQSWSRGPSAGSG